MVLIGNCVHTTGRADPAGGTEARLVTTSAGNLSVYEYLEGASTATGSSTYTVSRFVKAGSVMYVQLFVHATCSTGYANFSLSGSGSVTASSGVLNPQIQVVGNGWFRRRSPMSLPLQRLCGVGLRPCKRGWRRVCPR